MNISELKVLVSGDAAQAVDELHLRRRFDKRHWQCGRPLRFARRNDQRPGELQLFRQYRSSQSRARQHGQQQRVVQQLIDTIKPRTTDAQIQWVYDRSVTCGGCGTSYINIDPTTDLTSCSPPGLWAMTADKSQISMTCPTCSTQLVLSATLPEM